jgi:hypothetical protein
MTDSLNIPPLAEQHADKSMPKYFAVALSHNWQTGATLHQHFTGKDAADQAAGWVYKDKQNPDKSSFIQKDFPESEGWIHTWWSTQAAREVRAARLMDELGQGYTSEKVPR